MPLVRTGLLAGVRDEEARAPVNFYCPGVAVGGVEVLGGTAGAGAALVGIFNFCPTFKLSVVRLFACRNARTVVLNCAAIFVRVSPETTV